MTLFNGSKVTKKVYRDTLVSLSERKILYWGKTPTEPELLAKRRRLLYVAEAALAGKTFEQIAIVLNTSPYVVNYLVSVAIEELRQTRLTTYIRQHLGKIGDLPEDLGRRGILIGGEDEWGRS